MNDNLNLRVFRRNKKNIILIWNSESLKKDQLDSVSLEMETNGVFGPVEFQKFAAHNEAKFTRGVEGVVINQETSKLDPLRFYNFKVTLGSTNKIFKLISVLPFKSSTEKETRAVYLHAWDGAKGCWTKCDGAYDENGKFCLLIKGEKNFVD